MFTFNWAGIYCIVSVHVQYTNIDELITLWEMASVLLLYSTFQIILSNEQVELQYDSPERGVQQEPPHLWHFVAVSTLANLRTVAFEKDMCPRAAIHMDHFRTDVRLLFYFDRVLFGCVAYPQICLWVTGRRICIWHQVDCRLRSIAFLILGHYITVFELTIVGACFTIQKWYLAQK